MDYRGNGIVMDAMNAVARAPYVLGNLCELMQLVAGPSLRVVVPPRWNCLCGWLSVVGC